MAKPGQQCSERKRIHNQVCLYDRAGANVDGRGRRSELAGEGPDGRERVKKREGSEEKRIKRDRSKD